MNYSQIIKKLKSMKNEKNIMGMARFGITGKHVLGISIYVLRDMAKNIGKNHKLARELWKSEIHEARMLSVFIEEVDKVTSSQMDEMVLDFESWDDTDQACTSLFDQTPYAWSKVKEWSKREELFVKRAAFALLAGLAVHDKKAKNSDFNKLLPIIKKASTDERNFIKKAVLWAIFNIGKRNKELNQKMIKFSKELLESDSKTAKWIARNVIRKLSSEKVQKRLK